MNDRERPYAAEEWIGEPDAQERIKAREFVAAEEKTA